MKGFRRLKNPSSWRRISIATWRPPNDPSVYGSLLFDFGKGQEFLKKANEGSPVKITVTHLVAKALAMTLRHYPDLNGIIRWRQVYLRNQVDLFLQVAIAEKGEREQADLSGAKIESCDRKNLREIASELWEKSHRIRKREDPHLESSVKLFNRLPAWLLVWVLRGISFLIYDIGIYSEKFGIPRDPFGSAMVTSVGSLQVPAGFAPLVPFSRVPLIVCVGEVRERPWVVGGQVVARPVLDLGITFDHRFIDGLRASRMEKYFKNIIENPEENLLE